MTKDAIIRMAREAGFTSDAFVPDLERFAALVTAAEREACAQVCDEFADDAAKEQDFHSIATAEDCAAYIRARGQE